MKTMVDLVAMLDESKRRKICVYPVNANRASMLGERCLRKLVYWRTAWDKAIPHSLDLQYIFDEGSHQEEVLLRDLQEAGVRIIEQQRFFEWREYEITGHIDAKVLVEGEAYPLEIKSMSPNVWNQMENLSSLKKFPWTKKYLSQMVIYLLMSNSEVGIFLFKNKSTGRVKQFVVELERFWDLGDELLEKAKRVNECVRKNVLPEAEIDEDDCPNCPFRHLCTPEFKREAMSFEEDPELSKKLERWMELKPLVKEYEALDRELKKTLEGKDRMVVGDFLITGKWVERKMPPQPERVIRFWQRKVVRV